MPTPFMHLDYAERMIAHPRLHSDARARIVAERPAFYLGNIAADYQAICAVPREVTHFYPLPLLPEHTHIGMERMLSENPHLADAKALSEADAVFVAGYGTHLLADIRFLRQIVIPKVVFNTEWDGFDHRTRFTAVNVMLTVETLKSIRRLPDSAETTLAAATIPHLADFLQPIPLAQWKHEVWQQLAADDPVIAARNHSANLYAGRLHMDVDEFATCLSDPNWIDEIFYQRVPSAYIDAVFDKAVDDSIDLLNHYLDTA